MWCDVCGAPRLAGITSCPVCASRRIVFCNLCGDPKRDRLCPHCDEPCTIGDTDCPTCLQTMEGMADCKREFAGRPHPTPDEMHDGPVPIGAVDRCPQCGGRTYETDSGPWCPRAFCDAGAG